MHTKKYAPPPPPPGHNHIELCFARESSSKVLNKT